MTAYRYPQRSLSRRAAYRWLTENNPYPLGTTEHAAFEGDFWFYQKLNQASRRGFLRGRAAGWVLLLCGIAVLALVIAGASS